MRKLPFFLLLLTTYSCSDFSFNEKSKNAGGSFNYVINNEPSTLIPRYVNDLYSSTLLNQVYEGLVELDPKTLETKAGLAKDWTISPDGKTIQFQLRENVYFHKHTSIKGENKFTAEDVVYSIELACSPEANEASGAYHSIFKGLLEGADAFFRKEADHISGLKVRGNTIQIQLLQRDADFINKLTQTSALIVSKKAVIAGLEEELIGTGPFRFVENRIRQGRKEIVLERNKDYYGKDSEGKKLPYLDSLILKVENDKLQQLKMFENEEIHLIEGLPPSKISSMLGEDNIEDFNGTPPKFNLIRKPLLATQFYYFNLMQPEFQDIRVRKAINYAINRDSIIINVLKNQAFGKGDGGITPPAVFNGYNSDLVKKNGYSFQPEKARKLLTSAGYSDGKDFPTIQLTFNKGTIHSKVAKEIANQLNATLNVQVELKAVSFEEKLEDQKFARGDLFRSSWFAEYYSPESFLMTAYGKTLPADSAQPSMTNYSRYQNEEFDNIFEKAKNTDEIVERYTLFAEAESILMDDSPYIILWYEETIKIVYSKVRNLKLNEMNSYTFKKVYFKDWSKKEWESKEK
ncbi:ABC transporter substrate-binding protein [Brumimicrobium mesophilum]|uniref:ABC transporter substrate-binding protein n=1 Tax=Brumimicrobium mesophilum TaxID=392717 RepID=UPI000D1432A7|nr:ABC transporter substrate-binding protein [Brumimicrobium mesophilum]